ncbi:MAG TPA: glycosyltransferase family 1 protein [Candidatus Moranbacteria bacterium]|nr:glycosyltransferase family 1 protein [Candidatus Moranbacteria bacterium]HRY27755.1 glycosyltransferase family 1 protein [Candidatus Moranbacteria bacterium]HSA08166.1 glycosyltransferase family 1 protein [Candidatus Moranbacteria bacterium]
MIIGINASFVRKQNTGIGQVTLNFLRKLSELKVQSGKLKDVELFLYLEEKLPKDIKLPKNFKTRVFLPKYKRDDLIRKIWWENYLLPKKIKEDKCDVFLSLYQSATIIKDAKHIMLVHDIIPKLFPKYLNNLRKKIYQMLVHSAIKKADKIISISHRTEKDLIQHLSIDAAKISVAYIDVDEIYKKEVLEKESQRVLRKYKLKPGYILAGGGLEVRKNIKGVLEAYKILQEKYGQAGWVPKLAVYGKLMPELAPLVTDAEKIANELGIKKNVKLLDCVPQNDLPVLYKNASVFVYPSFYEGFGMPVLEAMNQGTPVLTSKTSSLPEVGSDAVLYCDPEKSDDIAAVIRNILNNNHIKAALSLKGKERATHFSWNKFVGKVMNIIKGLS